MMGVVIACPAMATSLIAVAGVRLAPFLGGLQGGARLARLDPMRGQPGIEVASEVSHGARMADIRRAAAEPPPRAQCRLCVSDVDRGLRLGQRV
jgi:hypothetical protein